MMLLNLETEAMPDAGLLSALLGAETQFLKTGDGIVSNPLYNPSLLYRPNNE